MDCNDAIEVRFFFENCESIHVPIKCFDRLDVTLNSSNMIDKLHCHIIDDGSITYGTTWCDNTISPIARLGQFNDIASIDIEFENRIDKYDVCWGGEGDWDPSNDRQSSKTSSYKEIEIDINDLSDSAYITDLLAVLDAFENDITIEDVKKSISSIEGRRRPYINDASTLIQALRQ